MMNATNIIRVVKTYWFVIIIGVVIVAMFWFMSNQNKKIEELRSDVEVTQTLVTDAKKTNANLEEGFDEEAHQETIKERTVSAKEIGEEMIAVDDALTAFYKTNDPLPENEKERDAVFADLEKMQAHNTELTGAKESDHIKTWQLNPEWDLVLESVVTYQDTDHVPIVFSMTTKDGDSAGLIHAIYNVNSHTLSNISRHYTTAGLQDEVDVGGI